MTKPRQASPFDPNTLFTLPPPAWDDRTRALAALGEIERTLASRRELPDAGFMDGLVQILIRNWARAPT